MNSAYLHPASFHSEGHDAQSVLQGFAATSVVFSREQSRTMGLFDARKRDLILGWGSGDVARERASEERFAVEIEL